MHIRISCGGRVKWTYGASDSVGLAWSWEFSFLTSPQVMLVLLLPSNHTLKTLHLISSQFQSDNAGLSSLIRITGCEVSARHGATQTPRVVLKRARRLWIRTCHTITQTLKLRKTILGKKKSTGFFLPYDTDGLEWVNFPLGLVFFILASYLNGLRSF